MMRPGQVAGAGKPDERTLLGDDCEWAVDS